ncbi:MAG TPA: dynamin family protein [Candidatus Limnocylindrales bacterium]|nr:dynamin family protein [Candidatus Limnocylindrales bacterium]
MTDHRPDLRALVERLALLAEARLELEPSTPAARTRATQLRDHATGHLRVRAAGLDAPLVVLLLGPTGAGKSSLFNALAGRAASPTGVLRPTTRTAVVLAHGDDLAILRTGALAGLGSDRLDGVADPALTPGLALVDAPDVDSIEHANRELADQLVEAADLAIFVTTATRYADRVPWTVLARVRERGLPIVVVVNRLPPSEADQAVVLEDVRRLFTDAGYSSELEVTGVAEGALDPGRDALDVTAVAPIRTRIDGLRADAEGRRRLAAEALAGSVAGVGPLVSRVADDVAHEQIDVAALRRTAAVDHDRELASLRDDLARGTFLRDEALRHWQRYVGADDVTRLFSRGIGAIRGAIASVFRPTTAPVVEVREATTDDLVAIVRQHAAEAARRTATAWADEPRVALAIGERADLWSVSDGFDDRLRTRLEGWIASIGEDIAATGEGKRKLARGASIGVNALGVGVMLATFIHTAGLTGTEVGVAAATAFLNQRLLGALFGEAAMVELISRARARLHAALEETFAEERSRFDHLVPETAALEHLARDLRAAAEEIAAVAASSGGPHVDVGAPPAPGRSAGVTVDVTPQ